MGKLENDLTAWAERQRVDAHGVLLLADRRLRETQAAIRGGDVEAAAFLALEFPARMPEDWTGPATTAALASRLLDLLAEHRDGHIAVGVLLAETLRAPDPVQPAKLGTVWEAHRATLAFLAEAHKRVLFDAQIERPKITREPA